MPAMSDDVDINIYRKKKAVGFRIIRSPSFATTLLPAMMISGFCQEKVSDKDFDAIAELKIFPWFYTLFSRLLNAALALISKGIGFLAGGSRLDVARKI
jgi:hypothetical protein